MILPHSWNRTPFPLTAHWFPYPSHASILSKFHYASTENSYCLSQFSFASSQNVLSDCINQTKILTSQSQIRFSRFIFYVHPLLLTTAQQKSITIHEQQPKKIDTIYKWNHKNEMRIKEKGRYRIGVPPMGLWASRGKCLSCCGHFLFWSSQIGSSLFSL